MISSFPLSPSGASFVFCSWIAVPQYIDINNLMELNTSVKNVFSSIVWHTRLEI